MSTILDAPPTDAPPIGGAPVPPAPDPTPAPTPPVADWRAGLPEELRAEKSLESFKDIASLAKSYIETKRMVGQRQDVPKPPTKESTPEQVAAWRKALGVPDTPAGYLSAGVVRPESAAGEWDEQAESAFFGVMHNLHAPPAVVNAAMQFYAKMESDKVATLTREAQAVAQELRREWGPNYDANYGRVRRLFSDYGDEQVEALFDRNGTGRDPVAIKFFSKLANDLVETGAMNPEGIASGMGPDEMRASIRQKQEELKGSLPEGHPRRRQLVEEILQLERNAMSTRR